MIRQCEQILTSCGDDDASFRLQQLRNLSLDAMLHVIFFRNGEVERPPRHLPVEVGDEPLGAARHGAHVGLLRRREHVQLDGLQHDVGLGVQHVGVVVDGGLVDVLDGRAPHPSDGVCDLELGLLLGGLQELLVRFNLEKVGRSDEMEAHTHIIKVY